MRTWHVVRRDGTRIPVEIRDRDAVVVEVEAQAIEVTLDDVLPEDEDDLDRIVRDVMDDAGI